MFGFDCHHEPFTKPRSFAMHSSNQFHIQILLSLIKSRVGQKTVVSIWELWGLLWQFCF